MSSLPLSRPQKVGVLLKTRACAVCGVLITYARLRAVPSASHCVACLEASGDVPVIKQLDSAPPESDVGQLFFTANSYFSDYLSRVNERKFVESEDTTNA